MGHPNINRLYLFTFSREDLFRLFFSPLILRSSPSTSFLSHNHPSNGPFDGVSEFPVLPVLTGPFPTDSPPSFRFLFFLFASVSLPLHRFSSPLSPPPPSQCLLMTPLLPSSVDQTLVRPLLF